MMEDDFPSRTNSQRALNKERPEQSSGGLTRLDSVSGRSIRDPDAYVGANSPNGNGSGNSGGSGGQHLWKKVMKRLKTVRHMEVEDAEHNPKVRDRERYSFDYPTGGRSSPSCDSFLDSQQELAIHRCSYCNRPFRTEALLGKHLDKHHYPGAPPVTNYANQSGIISNLSGENGQSSAGGGVSRVGDGSDSVLVDHSQPNFTIAEGGDLILDVAAPFAAPSSDSHTLRNGEEGPDSRRNSIFSTSGAVNGGDGSSQFNGISQALSPTEPAESIRATFLVSSQVLSTASPILKAMIQKSFLLPPRRRLQPAPDQSQGKLTLTPAAGKLSLVEDPQTFFLVLNILHHRNKQLPKKLEFHKLVNIAIIADKYQIQEPLQLWVERWVAPWRRMVKEPGYHDWLMIAWTFGYDDVFRDVSRELSLCTSVENNRLVVETNDRKYALSGYDNAAFVLDKLATLRQARITPLSHYLVSHRNGRTKNGYGPNWFCRTPVKKELGNSCDAFQLGHLILSLTTHSLEEGSPFWDRSVRDIIDSLDKIDIQSIDFSATVPCRCAKESVVPAEGGKEHEVKHTTCAIAHRACSWVPGLKEQIRNALSDEFVLSLEEFKKEIAASRDRSDRPGTSSGSTIRAGDRERERERERPSTSASTRERPSTASSLHRVGEFEGGSVSGRRRERRREGSVSGSVRKERRHRRGESEGGVGRRDDIVV